MSTARLPSPRVRHLHSSTGSSRPDYFAPEHCQHRSTDRRSPATQRHDIPSRQARHFAIEIHSQENNTPQPDDPATGAHQERHPRHPRGFRARNIRRTHSIPVHRAMASSWNARFLPLQHGVGEAALPSPLLRTPEDHTPESTPVSAPHPEFLRCSLCMADRDVLPGAPRC